MSLVVVHGLFSSLSGDERRALGMSFPGDSSVPLHMNTLPSQPGSAATGYQAQGCCHLYLESHKGIRFIIYASNFRSQGHVQGRGLGMCRLERHALARKSEHREESLAQDQDKIQPFSISHLFSCATDLNVSVGPRNGNQNVCWSFCGRLLKERPEVRECLTHRKRRS